MIVCKHCMQAIESHEGNLIKRKLSVIDDADEVFCGHFDDNGNFIEDEYGSEECIYCEWCKECIPIDDAYEL